MKNALIPARATDIDDREFWKSLRVPPGARKAGPLAEAIRFGRAGKYESAYAALADYHRVALQGEWALIREGWIKRPAPDSAVLRNLFNHKLPVWHKQVIQFGPTIDWWPEGQVSDNICGLHRLHWLQPALAAFIQTGEARYRDFLIDMVGQFDGARRHPRWADIRQLTFNFLEATSKWSILQAIYLALIHGGGIPPRTASQLLRLFLGFGRATSATLGPFIPGYNAQAVAFTTLLHIARVFPEFRASPAWDRQASRMVVDHARKGFYADGGNKERVWGYGMMHVSALSQPYEIARRFGGLRGHEREVSATLRRACQWYVKTAAPPPTYGFPTYGDAGWGAHDSLPTLQAMVSRLPGFKKDPFLGVDRTHGYLLKPSGFVVLRNGDTSRSSYVNLNFGPFGGWHSHWDLLSMNFWAFGKPLLEELCRFGPYANPLDTLFRQPESHNLMLIDGMVYDSRLVEGQDVQWHSDKRVEYFSATHRAYRYFVYGRDALNVSPNIEAKVRRTVLLVKDPGYVVVLDAVENLNHPTFNRAVSQYWHAPTAFRVVGPGAVRTDGHTACLLVQGRTEGLHRLDTSKDFGGAEVDHLGHAYERYGLRARRWMPIGHLGITGFSTVLYPFQGKQPKVTVTPLKTEGGALFRTEALEIVTPDGTDVVILNPERRSGLAWKGKPMKARAFVRLGRGRGDAVVK
ncbi:MAG: heparinase II/III family protein [Lentisphaerae bacterium]|nr:heparinase II/III family protein [Lentisphaerota bacterium]